MCRTNIKFPTLPGQVTSSTKIHPPSSVENMILVRHISTQTKEEIQLPLTKGGQGGQKLTKQSNEGGNRPKKGGQGLSQQEGWGFSGGEKNIKLKSRLNAEYSEDKQLMLLSSWGALKITDPK